MKTIVVKKNDNKEEGSNQPDYRMAALDENEEWQEVAALWKKEKNGQTFLSGKMKNQYGEKPGYSVEKEGQEEASKESMKEQAQEEQVTADDIDW